MKWIDSWKDKKHLKRCFFDGFERSEKPVLSILDTYRNNVIFILLFYMPLKALICKGFVSLLVY